MLTEPQQLSGGPRRDGLAVESCTHPVGFMDREPRWVRPWFTQKRTF